MKTTGYRLRETIRMWELRRKMAGDNFDKSLHAFEGEDRESPQEVVIHFKHADEAVANLQTAQAMYNLSVKVNVLGENMTLCEAVKRVGGAGRIEKLWRTAATDKKDRYAYDRDLVRSTDEVRARRTITLKDAGDLAANAAKWAGALRAAIAVANSTEVDVEGLNPELFE